MALGARAGALTTRSAVTGAWVIGVSAVMTFVRTGASFTSSAFKTVWLMGAGTAERLASTGASAVWSVFTAVWMTDVPRVKFVAWTFAKICAGTAMLCLHFPGGESTSLDWFTFALGVFGTSIAFLILGDLDGCLGIPTFLRFLAANCVGAAVATYVTKTSGFNWNDSDTRVLGFGGAALWMVGVHNLNLSLALSEAVVEPFCRLAVAVAAAITTAAAAAVHCGYHPPGQADLDLEALKLGILMYASVSTWPLLVWFVKKCLLLIVGQFNNVPMRVRRVGRVWRVR